jgi:regulator of RNase E activity RraA
MKDSVNIITLDQMRESLYSAVVCDALDALGFERQSPRIQFSVRTVDAALIGRCRTTLWEDFAGEDPKPYEKELIAVDRCQPDDVVICAAHGSTKSGVWGELLSTAAKSRGSVGAVVDGAVRDTAKMRAMPFALFARDTSVYDSKNRQRVIQYDIPVVIDGVTFGPGDLVVADGDGIVVVPREAEQEAIASAWKKVHDENQMREAMKNGMSAVEAYDRFGVL